MWGIHLKKDAHGHPRGNLLVSAISPVRTYSALRRHTTPGDDAPARQGERWTRLSRRRSIVPRRTVVRSAPLRLRIDRPRTDVPSANTFSGCRRRWIHAPRHFLCRDVVVHWKADAGFAATSHDRSKTPHMVLKRHNKAYLVIFCGSRIARLHCSTGNKGVQSLDCQTDVWYAPVSDVEPLRVCHRRSYLVMVLTGNSGFFSSFTGNLPVIAFDKNA